MAKKELFLVILSAVEEPQFHLVALSTAFPEPCEMGRTGLSPKKCFTWPYLVLKCIFLKFTGSDKRGEVRISYIADGISFEEMNK